MQQDELEVTGEGTAGGPFGLKKVLFVRKKSEKGLGSKEVSVLAIFHHLVLFVLVEVAVTPSTWRQVCASTS